MSHQMKSWAPPWLAGVVLFALAGCIHHSDMPVPPAWPAMAALTRADQLDGAYDAKSEEWSHLCYLFFEGAQKQAETASHFRLRVVSADQIEAEAWQEEKLLMSRPAVFRLENNAVTIERSRPGTEGLVGRIAETWRLQLDVTGALIVRKKRSAAGVAYMIPLHDSSTSWARFLRVAQ